MAIGFQRSQDIWTEKARFEAQISECPYFDYSHVISTETVWDFI